MMPMMVDIRGGGAILNRGTIGKIDAEFNNNIFKYDRGGGAILNEGDIKEIYGKFTANKGPAGGAITNMNKIDLISAEFYANSADMGSALANGGEINEIKILFSKTITILPQFSTMALSARSTPNSLIMLTATII